jgi:catechol 2,3-dioxygenase
MNDQAPILQSANASDRLHPELQFGPVELTVSNLERSLTFYQQVVGVAVLEQSGSTAILGAGSRPLLILSEIPGAPPAPLSSPGLYHFALLLLTRTDLARWAKHAASLGVRVGQSDHLVSEALYLNDPDRHGIEIYRDRLRHEWHWDFNQVRMANDPIDLQSLLNELGAHQPFAGLPGGTVIGHVHLRVTELATTKRFYREQLDFDLTTRFPGALFMSVGGYHHHFGLNVWQSQGGTPAPDTAAKLQRVNVILPNEAAIAHLSQRLQEARAVYTRDQRQLDLRDPSGNKLRFMVSV